MTLTNTIATWQQAELVRLLKNAPGTQYQESDDVNQAIIRDWVRSLIQKAPVTVVFTKADGTDREMLCTLNGDYIPTTAVPVVPVDGIVQESKKPRKEPDVHSIRVFDLEKMEWRSFRYDRLQRVTASLEFN
jgi:hypothetical protein